MDPSWIATAFTAVNSIRVVFYLPQILAVVRSTDGARDIALSTWALWALTNALGTAYGAVVARDALLAVSFALSMVACCATIALTGLQRLRWARRAAVAASVTEVAQPASLARRGLAECCPADPARPKDSSAAASAVRSVLRSTLARHRDDSDRSTDDGVSIARMPVVRSVCSNTVHTAAACARSVACTAAWSARPRR